MNVPQILALAYTQHIFVNTMSIRSVLKKCQILENLISAAYFNLRICAVKTSCSSWSQNFKLYAISILYYIYYYVPD